MPGLGTSLRRTVARRAERLLGTLGLVEPRPPPARPAQTVAVPVPASAVAAPVAAAPVETDEVGPALSRADVARVLDDLVRPALQSDGGDIELVDVVGGEVRVRLVGSCSSCPSSVMTMKMGVERLLEDELPGFVRLVQVES